MKKLGYITVLRALAILSVLTVHVTLATTTQTLPPILDNVLNNGARGVQLFYLLSAFTLFLTCSYRSGHERYPKFSFFLRRFFRIAPLYYLAVIYYLWQDGLGPRYWLGDAPGISTANIASNFLFVHSFSPYWINSIVPGGWSVAIEFVFYSIFPFLFLWIRNMRQAVNFTLITLGIRTVLMILFTRHPLIHDQTLWGNYLFLYLPNQLPIFSMGIWLYFIIYEKDKLDIPGRSILLFAIFAIAGLVMQTDLFIPNLIWYGFAFLTLAVALSKYQPWLLFNPVVEYIGTISYTIYLTHFAAIHFLKYIHLLNPFKGQSRGVFLANLAANYAATLVTSIAICTVLYYLIEKPMMDFGKRVIARFNSPSNVAAALETRQTV